MEIIKTGKTTKTHHTVIVDGVPYFRNEEFEYNSNGELVRQICDWYVGDKDGKGPYVKPGGVLDHIKKYTNSELEKKFNKKFK